MKNFYNREFENIDTPEKAYVLGLWYADGFVSYNKEKYKSFSSVKLHIRDLELLEKIKNNFNFFYIETPKNTNVCILRCNLKLFVNDLINNGIYSNKSGINKDLLKFPNIDFSLYSHFIRGYFDGDGSIYFMNPNGTTNKGFTFTGNNYKFIKKLQEVLWNEGIYMKLNFKRGGESTIREQKIIFKSLTFNLISQNQTIIKKAFKYLYKNSSIHLERKYIKFNTWEIKKIKTSPKCPFCKSDKTQWQIKNKYIICRNCKKYSKITALL